MDRMSCDRMFVAVVELNSFAKAAELKGTSVSQASKMVTRLEQTLGAQLLHRSTRSLSPTEIGLAYYQQIRSLLKEYDALESSVQDQFNLPAGRIRISAPSSFGVTQLSHALVAFSRQYPQIELDVSFTDRVVNVIEEGFDVAFRIGQLKDSNLVCSYLTDIHILLVASPDYIEKYGQPEKPEDLHQHQCIIDTNFKEPYQWQFISTAQPNTTEHVLVNGQFNFANTEVCHQFTLAGLGVCRIPSFICGPSIQAKQLVPLLPDYKIQSTCLYAVYPSARYLARKVRALVDFIKQFYSTTPQWNQF